MIALGYLRQEAAAPWTLGQGETRWQMLARVANSQAQSDVVEENLERLLEDGRRRGIDADFLRQASERDPSGRIYHVDGEMAEWEVRWRRGLAAGWEIGADLPVRKIGGGFLDGVVEDFHQLIAVDQDGRAGLLRDGYRVYFLERDEELLITERPNTGLGDAKFHLKRALGGWPFSGSSRLGEGLSAVELTLKAPTGEEGSLYSSGSWDVGLQWHLGLVRGRWSGFTSLGLARTGDWPTMRLEAEWLASLHVALEWAKTRRTAFSAQLSTWQSPYESLDLVRLSDSAVFYLTLAWHIRAKAAGEVFIGVTENVVHFENSADLSFVVGWRP